MGLYWIPKPNLKNLQNYDRTPSFLQVLSAS